MANKYIKIKIDTSSLERLAYRLRASPSKAHFFLTQRIGNYASKVTLFLIGTTPKRSGRLAQSTRLTQIDNSWIISQSAMAFPRKGGDYLYSRVVRFGTIKKDYLITPFFKKALWWPGIEDDRPVSKVIHPGQKGNRYDITTLERAEGVTRSIISDTTKDFWYTVTGK